MVPPQIKLFKFLNKKKDKNMKNILVVGGTGYVGGAVTDVLLKENVNVRVYDNLLYEDSYMKDVDFIYGDVRDRYKLFEQLQWADTVVWLAAIVGDGACQLNPELTLEINQNSVKWLSENFDGRIIFTSTCSVYGIQEGEINEEIAPNPLSLYASTKLNAESYLSNKNSVVFRLGTLFGLGDQFSRIRLDLVVNILTVKAYSTGKVSVFGGEQFRPLLHVKDAAEAIKLACFSSEIGVFNLHRQNVRIIDLAYQIRNHFPDIQIEVTEMHFQDTRNYKVISKKAIEKLGFNPIYTIDDGIEEIKKLLLEHRIKNINHSRYSNFEYLKLNSENKL